ncbi:hypothetical protein [Aquimarina sp. AU474]|uniref:hypothetical protein n=1 Tax=Aquimarina sp. AU474 TaxID=2108529 RepID=UPI000D6855DF|nr:hypothetical protein [Aquimarina sp. AU474]
MNKRILYINSLLAFSLLSCDNFVLKKEHKEEIVKERLDKLNWSEVDQPPLFEICKRKSEEELESCFQKTITKHIHDHLSKQSISTKKPIQDTIWVPLLITKESVIIIEDFELPDIVISEIPNLKQILEEGIHSLPKVKPAHTRSTPVSARYQLPLVIRID